MRSYHRRSLDIIDITDEVTAQTFKLKFVEQLIDALNS